MIALVRSETTKLLTTKATWILALVTVLGTLPMAWTNSASTADLPADAATPVRISRRSSRWDAQPSSDTTDGPGAALHAHE